MTRDERISELGAEVVFRGIIFDVIRTEVETPTGRSHYEYAVCDDVVRVYPIDDNDTLWLIGEVKPGLSKERILRAVSGAVEDGETPEGAAKRELYEELGVNARSFQYLRCSTPTLKLLHSVHHVLALGVSTPPRDWEPPPGSDEDIEPVAVSLSSLADLAWSGDIVEDSVALSLLRIARDHTNRYR